MKSLSIASRHAIISVKVASVKMTYDAQKELTLRRRSGGIEQDCLRR